MASPTQWTWVWVNSGSWWWTGRPGELQSMGSLRVRHDWATSLSLSCIGKGNGNPLQCSCLETPRDGGACWAAVYGVAQSRTRLKWLSSSNSSSSISTSWTPVFSPFVIYLMNIFYPKPILILISAMSSQFLNLSGELFFQWYYFKFLLFLFDFLYGFQLYGKILHFSSMFKYINHNYLDWMISVFCYYFYSSFLHFFFDFLKKLVGG